MPGAAGPTDPKLASRTSVPTSSRDLQNDWLAIQECTCLRIAEAARDLSSIPSPCTVALKDTLASRKGSTPLRPVPSSISAIHPVGIAAAGVHPKGIPSSVQAISAATEKAR